LNEIIAGTTLQFAAGTTQYVTNMINFQNVGLLSTTNGTTWYLKYTGGSQTIVDVAVRDSNAGAGSTLIADSASMNLGNNTNWSFPDSGVRYWAGSGTSNWSSPSSWALMSGGAGPASVPMSTNTVIFNGLAGYNGDANIDVVVNVATLTISGYAGTIDTQGADITISTSFSQTSGTVSLGTSSFTLQGNFSHTAGTFNADTSTVTFSGTQNQSLTLAGTSLYDMAINKAGGALTLVDALDLTGDFTLTAGTLVTSSQTISIAGNWTRSGGNYNGGGSTVTFDGSGVSTLSGFTTFYSFRALTAGATLQFTAGTTQYITNAINLQNISLKSTTDTATWYFKMNGSSQTISDVNVRDSNAIAGNYLRADFSSSDLANNVNWAFGDVRYWSAAGATAWNLTTGWSYASGGATGANVPTSTHTVIFNGANSRNGVANMAGAVTISTMIISNYIGTINTLGATVTVTSNYIQSNGVISLGTSVFIVQGNLIQSAGTFTAGTSTVTFSGGNNQTLTAPSATFKNIIVNKSGNTLTLGSALTATGNLTFSGATFDTSNSGNYTVTTTSDVTVGAGTFLANASAINLGGNWTNSTTNFNDRYFTF
jgi:hypothetical protein